MIIALTVGGAALLAVALIAWFIVTAARDNNG